MKIFEQLRCLLFVRKAVILPKSDRNLLTDSNSFYFLPSYEILCDMQMMRRLKFIHVCLVVMFQLLPYSSAQASDEPEVKLSSSFRNSNTEDQRLRTCIKAIDQKVIYVGMRLTDLDNFLGSAFALKSPSDDADLTYSTYKFGKTEFSWRLLVKHNRHGKVVGYYLNNLTYKGYSSLEPPKASIAEITTTFRRAKTTSQKLDCTIQAIDSHVIKNGTLRTTLYAIFGNKFKEKEVRRGWYSSTYSFNSSKNSWRLIFCGDSDSIFHYFLTNSKTNCCI